MEAADVLEEHENRNKLRESEVMGIIILRLGRLLLFLLHLGANGEISLSLAQLMVGGGTLWTSHVRMASSPSVTDILSGPVGPAAPPALGRGRTGDTHSSE